MTGQSTPGQKKSADPASADGAGQDQDAGGDWQELYLKIALLWVDKPAFVKALIAPDFKPKSNHPTIALVVVISLAYSVTMTLYAFGFIATYPDKVKPWAFMGPCAGFAWLILAGLNPAYHIFKYRLWQEPMTVKARISAIPPPVRDQGDDHAKTVYSRVAYTGGSAYAAVGAFIFLLVDAPVVDILASLFVRDSLIAVVERWSANKTAVAQAEAVILGVLGTNVQFADNCSGDIVVRPSALRALKWQDGDIMKQMERASKDVEIKLTIFDLDRAMPSIIERSGATLMPITMNVDLAALGFFKEGINYVAADAKAKAKELLEEAVGI